MIVLSKSGLDLLIAQDVFVSYSQGTTVTCILNRIGLRVYTSSRVSAKVWNSVR